MNRLARIIACLVFGALAGCVSWTATTGSFTSRRIGITTATPLEWYQISNGRVSVFTRNGKQLESVTIEALTSGDTLYGIGKAIDKRVLLHEIPRFFLNNYAVTNLIFDVRVIREKLVSLDSLPAAKIEYTYNTAGRVRMRSTTLFCVRDDRIYVVDYSAPERFYYDAYRANYEKMVASLRFLR
jgi:hypothetical protein